MSTTLADPPRTTTLVTQQKDATGTIAYIMHVVWDQWLTRTILKRLQATAQVLTVVTKTGQNTSIGTTFLPLPALASGQYRVSWYARITTPATTGAATSSLIVTLGWTETAQALTVSGTAITGNAVTSVQSGTITVDVDQASALSYSTTYASNTAGQMQYRLSIVCEQVN